MTKSLYRNVLIVILVISLGMMFFENVGAMTGHATEGSTPSEVTITSYLSIDMSANLTNQGIIFESPASLPATDLNATLNYNGSSSSTLYYINVSTDSNSAVDFCLKANQGLESSASDLIGLGNETYATNVTTSDVSNPETPVNTMTTSYTKTASNIPIGEANYYRFWLDIPAGQATGTYNNTVFFEGVTHGVVCSS